MIKQIEENKRKEKSRKRKLLFDERQKELTEKEKLLRGRREDSAKHNEKVMLVEQGQIEVRDHREKAHAEQWKRAIELKEWYISPERLGNKTHTMTEREKAGSIERRAQEQAAEIERKIQM